MYMHVYTCISQPSYVSIYFLFLLFCFEPVLWNSLSLTKHNKMRTILLANVKNE